MEHTKYANIRTKKLKNHNSKVNLFLFLGATVVFSALTIYIFAQRMIKYQMFKVVYF